jgi:hypothetical protein
MCRSSCAQIPAAEWLSARCGKCAGRQDGAKTNHYTVGKYQACQATESMFFAPADIHTAQRKALRSGAVAMHYRRPR